MNTVHGISARVHCSVPMIGSVAARYVPAVLTTAADVKSASNVKGHVNMARNSYVVLCRRLLPIINSISNVFFLYIFLVCCCLVVPFWYMFFIVTVMLKVAI